MPSGSPDWHVVFAGGLGETGLQTALKGGEETNLETGNGHSKVRKKSSVSR